MNPKLLWALSYVIKYLDNIMETSPNQKTADAANYLQTMYDQLKERNAKIPRP